MDIDILKKGKERETYTNYINELNDDINALKLLLDSKENFKGQVFLLSKRHLVIKCHKYLTLNVIFEKEPKKAEINLEKKYLNLINLKFLNHQAIDFIKKLINEEIIIVEYPRIYTLIFPTLFVKILQKDQYELSKDKYLKRKSFKIYTGLKIIK